MATDEKPPQNFRSREQQATLGLLRTADAVKRSLAQVIAPHGITPQQYNVLRILRGAGPDGLPTLTIGERMIEQTPGVGPKMARTIHEQLHDEQMAALIDDLRTVGLTLQEEGPPPGEGPLAGKTLVLTGTLPELTREQATELIIAAGGKVTGSVSRRTDYVVAGESPGTKLAQAERLGVAVVDERGLLDLLG